MESLIVRLQADVEARKRPHLDLRAAARTAALLSATLLIAFEMGARSVDPAAGWTARSSMLDRTFALGAEVTGLQRQLDNHRQQLQRLQEIQAFSTRYRISADLALTIYEAAASERLDPGIAFELVRVESRFNPRAVSSAGALGLAQVMPATANDLMPGVSTEQIFDPDTNLRLGFRFLQSMITRYDGDLRLALLAYNRGPTTVDRLLGAGEDPGNGYDVAVLGGMAD
jgi:soluble lytic murein transglycosylase-like protein